MTTIYIHTTDHYSELRKGFGDHQRKMVKEQRKQKSVGVEGDYVRVKARRGEATDSHSLAERARRAKIRMKMKLLQSLVPGCEKVSGKAHVLDEIIKYVQLLQNQVESLATKLAFVDLMILHDSDPSSSVDPHPPQGLCCFDADPWSESSYIPFMSFADDATPSGSASLLPTEASLMEDDEDFLLDMEEDQYCEDIVDQPEALN